jgi:Glycosyl transferase family 2
MPAYSVVITSCGRFDLLRATLASLLPNLDIRPRKIVIVEDSCDPAVANVAGEFDGKFHILVNQTKLGQMASIDRAYSTVSTPYIFHCEDDWEFFRTGFIAESATLLEQYPEVSMVALRARDDLNPLMRDVPSREENGLRFFFYEPKRHPEYFSHSFNPGLRRLSDYKKIGPYAPLGYEPDISYAFKRGGFYMAGLEIPAVRHIGWDRHVKDPFQPARSRTLVQRVGKSIAKRWKRIKRRHLLDGR